MGILDRLFGKKMKNAPDARMDASAANIHQDQTVKEQWEEVAGVPQELAASEVLAMYNSAQRPVFLDVREPHELEADGWIPGSIHIPMNDVESRLGELDRAKPVVVYCASGMRSMDAGAFLLQKGFQDVSNLNGGITGWAGPKERKQ